MLALLLLQAAAAQTAVDAERAFNAMAQEKGQWTAFRAFAAPEAAMFDPQPVEAHELLTDARDPKVSVRWAPTESFVSCDGNMAVNTGPWTRPDSKGYFTTVWLRQPDGKMKWIVDGGDTLAKPLPWPVAAVVRTASCEGRPAPVVATPYRPWLKSGSGLSQDSTLYYSWTVAKDGSRDFSVALWNGSALEYVLEQHVAAPKK